MIVQVMPDVLMEAFEVGDLVRFSLEEDSVYSYEVPKMGTIGLIEVQTYSLGLEQMLGVQVPMSVVQWENGQKIQVFSHDLGKIVIPDHAKELMVSKLKSLPPYTGKNIN